MRFMTIVLLSLTFIGTVQAAPTAQLITGKFNMTDMPNGNPGIGCGTGTTLTMDNAKISGDVVLLSDYAFGPCQQVIDPNPRYFIPESIEKDSCGATVTKGKVRGSEGPNRIEITDNRGNTCENVIPALIVMKIQTADGGEYLLYGNEAPKLEF
jgi:hypothetical protein